MNIIIPSAGYATRLYPLTHSTPKALLEIGGKRIIEHLFEKIRELPNIHKVVIVTNELFYERFMQWYISFPTEFSISILNDHSKSNDDRLGAVQDIFLAVKYLHNSDDILVLHSDNIFSFSLVPLADYFRELRKTLIGLFDVHDPTIAKRLGTVKVNENSRILSFQEKQIEVESTISSVGIYFFSKEVITLLQTYLEKGNSPDGTGNFIKWLLERREVYGFLCSCAGEYWFDIGTPESYALANTCLNSLSLKK